MLGVNAKEAHAGHGTTSSNERESAASGYGSRGGTFSNVLDRSLAFGKLDERLWRREQVYDRLGEMKRMVWA